MKKPNFFRRFFLGDFGPPPPPDLSHQPEIAGQTVVEILYSQQGDQRAIITCDTKNIYRVHPQFWDTSDWKDRHEAFWYGEGSSSLTDNIDSAREITKDLLNTSED